jgi:hypothetical protein
MKPSPQHISPAPRRYPSLADDGQPWFPAGWWPRPFAARYVVRGLALAGIVAIIVILFTSR